MTGSYRLSGKAILKGDEGLFLVYNTASGKILELNETAFEILSFCQRNKTKAQIARMIRTSFINTPNDDALSHDIEALLAKCEKNRILNVTPSGR